MRHRPGFHISDESTGAVWNYVKGYEAAAVDAGQPCDYLRGFDEWVNLYLRKGW
jgi:hypothetical protein